MNAAQAITTALLDSSAGEFMKSYLKERPIFTFERIGTKGYMALYSVWEPKSGERGPYTTTIGKVVYYGDTDDWRIVEVQGRIKFIEGKPRLRPPRSVNPPSSPFKDREDAAIQLKEWYEKV